MKNHVEKMSKLKVFDGKNGDCKSFSVTGQQLRNLRHKLSVGGGGYAAIQTP
jgi:hypothetical protein